MVREMTHKYRIRDLPYPFGYSRTPSRTYGRPFGDPGRTSATGNPICHFRYGSARESHLSGMAARITVGGMTAETGRWIRNFVAGQFVEPDENRSFDKTDPATGRVFARVHEADRDLVDRAVSAARRALHD